MSKRYTLELTAEELEDIIESGSAAVMRRVGVLAGQARADREADDLRLPWTIDRDSGERWVCVDNRASSPWVPFSQRAAKLMSAAPELLEAVKAAKQWFTSKENLTAGGVQRLIDRALRKAETGVPE